MSLRPPSNTPLPASLSEAPSEIDAPLPLEHPIENASVAKETMETVRLQILQQSRSAFYAQANSSLKSVLSFL